MRNSSTVRRLVLLLAALPLLLTLAAVTYRAGMLHLEGQERTFWQALEWAAETMTTTGYGADTSWTNPLMVLFVVGMQFLGVTLVYMLVPVVLIPMLEARFEAKLPRLVPEMDDHIVIFRYGVMVETLIEQLLQGDIKILVIEADEVAARELLEMWPNANHKRRGQVFLLFDRDLADGLRKAHLPKARALLLNGSDEANASAALIAQELEFEHDVLAFVEEPHHRKPLRAAGATAVYTPRHALGAALAARASHRIQPRVDGIQQLSANLRVAEIRIDPSSPLVGKTLAEADLAAATGATVVGQWRQGDIDAKPTAQTELKARGILVVIGEAEALDRLSELATDGRSARVDGPIVVAGYGEVGRKVTQLLTDAGEPVIRIDRDSTMDDVDVVGDITDPRTFDQVDLDTMRAVVLALNSDSAALFASLILAQAAPDLPIIARVNRAENLDRMHRAGADFALSISHVGAQIISHRLLGRDSRALATKLRLLKTSARGVANRQLSALDIRQRTGCSVVAVERDGSVITRLDADFRFLEGDMLYVCGHGEATADFAEHYCDDED